MYPVARIHRTSLREAVDDALRHAGVDPKDYSNPQRARDLFIRIQIDCGDIMSTMIAVKLPIVIWRQAKALPDSHRPWQGQQVDEWYELVLPDPYEPLAHEVWLNEFHGMTSPAGELTAEMRQWLASSIVGHVRWNGLFGFSFSEFEDAVLFKLRWYQ